MRPHRWIERRLRAKRPHARVRWKGCLRLGALRRQWRFCVVFRRWRREVKRLDFHLNEPTVIVSDEDQRATLDFHQFGLH